MVLMNVIEDMSMPVVGLERRAYMCSACGITEQRTEINKQAGEKLRRRDKRYSQSATYCTACKRR